MAGDCRRACIVGRATRGAGAAGLVRPGSGSHFRVSPDDPRAPVKSGDRPALRAAGPADSILFGSLATRPGGGIDGAGRRMAGKLRGGRVGGPAVARGLRHRLDRRRLVRNLSLRPAAVRNGVCRSADRPDELRGVRERLCRSLGGRVRGGRLHVRRIGGLRGGHDLLSRRGVCEPAGEFDELRSLRRGVSRRPVVPDRGLRAGSLRGVSGRPDLLRHILRRYRDRPGQLRLVRTRLRGRRAVRPGRLRPSRLLAAVRRGAHLLWHELRRSDERRGALRDVRPRLRPGGIVHHGRLFVRRRDLRRGRGLLWGRMHEHHVQYRPLRRLRACVRGERAVRDGRLPVRHRGLRGGRGVPGERLDVPLLPGRCHGLRCDVLRARSVLLLGPLRRYRVRPGQLRRLRRRLRHDRRGPLRRWRLPLRVGRRLPPGRPGRPLRCRQPRRRPALLCRCLPRCERQRLRPVRQRVRRRELHRLPPADRRPLPVLL